VSEAEAQLAEDKQFIEDLQAKIEGWIAEEAAKPKRRSWWKWWGQRASEDVGHQYEKPTSVSWRSLKHEWLGMLGHDAFKKIECFWLAGLDHGVQFWIKVDDGYCNVSRSMVAMARGWLGSGCTKAWLEKYCQYDLVHECFCIRHFSVAVITMEYDHQRQELLENRWAYMANLASHQRAYSDMPKNRWLYKCPEQRSVEADIKRERDAAEARYKRSMAIPPPVPAELLPGDGSALRRASE
jgi:hypothetical protein